MAAPAALPNCACCCCSQPFELCKNKIKRNTHTHLNIIYSSCLRFSIARGRERERARVYEMRERLLLLLWQAVKYLVSSLTETSRQETLSEAATQAGEYAQVVEHQDRHKYDA